MSDNSSLARQAIVHQRPDNDNIIQEDHHDTKRPRRNLRVYFEIDKCEEFPVDTNRIFVTFRAIKVIVP